MSEPDRYQRAVQRALRRRMSRRDLLRYTGRGVGAFGAGALLAACGVEGQDTAPRRSPGAASPSPSPLPPKAGVVNVANWPLYIDLEDGQSATLDKFKQATGIDINYKEDIGDNDEFFGTDLQQQIQAGQATEWDIIVMTDWMIDKLIQLGWLEPLHHDVLPNVTANLDAKFNDPWYDPGNGFSVPYAAGITGIGYNKKLTGRPITSIADLFDTEFAGQVGMFSEMRDTYNFALLLMGKDPTTATLADIEAATETLRQQRDDGIVRAYYGNDYTDQLAGGNLALTMAWSGDVNYLALDNPDLAFVVPDEGGNRWTDNLAIPLRAEHPTDAHAWIDFVYDVEVATGITEWVWYESPVAGVQQQIQEDAQEDPSLEPVAESDLVWPTPEILEKTHSYKRLSLEEEEAWHELFDPLIQG
ncbi:MAG: spermidine/putrescine ABC transporter substrate-binding protein [Actinobacteria bacterium]|nr:spermidine/putrescine ABC transporter substrate-binding protein [Actinomycetota bacterium]